MAKEVKIPKAYSYTVEGVVDDQGTLKKFTVPSLSRDIHDEFDADCIAGSAALAFYLDNEDYRELEKWPLKFKFQTSTTPVELEMNLSYSPCFLSTPKKIVKTITATESSTETEESEAIVEEKTNSVKRRKRKPKDENPTPE